MNYFKKISLSALIIVTANLLQAKESEIKITTINVNNGVYMLMGQGGNIGLSVGEDGVFMIDDQFAPLSAKIKAAISKISKKPLKFVINTHWHFDHTGGNENFGKDGAIIVSHNNVRKRMSKEGFIKAFNKTIPAAPKVALPIITFNDEINFYFNNEEIEVLHQKNAHTDGDSIIFFKSSNVVHTGDIYFNGFYPFIDSSSQGSMNGIITSVNYILSRINDETKIIPGHGKLSNKKELISYRDTLIILRDRMQALIKEGKSIDEIIAMKPNADLDETWGKGFLNPETFLKILYGVIKDNMK
ncbi:MAG: MBL fold metallo-hydrolase [Campylobacteraceae bacterium]|nr:MBL fold metallo-hydrolase [Campylobacteraceae bacterium]